MATITCDYCKRYVEDIWIPTGWRVVEDLWWNRIACDQCESKWMHQIGLKVNT